MQITFHGGARIVTGSNYLLEHEGASILIDCGLHQGPNYCEKHNWNKFPYDPSSILAVFVTHAHIDHTGRLPKLFKDGFRGTVYSTPPTRDFANLLLLDSDHILAEEARRFKFEPLYSADDVGGLMERWKGIPYHESIEVGPFKVTLHNAGHILGSCFISVEAGGEVVLFSGDLGNSPAPIIGAREIFEGKATYCLIESTYGDRIHEKLPERKDILENMIEDTIKKGGTLLIPAFAMERTQELLYELNDLVNNGRVPKVPIFLDSPLAIKLTSVYQNYTDYFTEETQRIIAGGDNIFSFPGLKQTLTTEESKSINEVPSPKVIIAGSGMSHGGRIVHHEKKYLSDPKSTLFIVGYQAHGSLGRQILDGASSVRILGEDVPIRAGVVAVGGYSAHADQPQLLEWLKPLRTDLKKVFVVQGEEEASKALSQKIVDELAIHTVIPNEGDTAVL
ncbi:MAG: MBL fold hydrolase [Candidatus Harrisonbacteria bacterium CG10_big_fil_rev_8_21_14_0_10_40_38]|uniref:MBL fold hydrolase n=1 Tax=Candidatus Harrisonbacteria bacterium CG10_big_fil_rev_8_21_14_0_10_40_38 TaxID=1974583 RepID=A0A2H0UT84_9BACT|nr:MAG: MBL fold hydrolase [Candidatus Harrisonbacteria bacterium CG10_big_fil_rev_8_21_14_0_10_40_38]